jgi:hypothetical protein
VRRPPFTAFAGRGDGDSGEVALPGPTCVMSVAVDLDGIRRVRFTATDDESRRPGLSAIEQVSRPGGARLGSGSCRASGFLEDPSRGFGGPGGAGIRRGPGPPLMRTGVVRASAVALLNRHAWELPPDGVAGRLELGIEVQVDGRQRGRELLRAACADDRGADAGT